MQKRMMSPVDLRLSEEETPADHVGLSLYPASTTARNRENTAEKKDPEGEIEVRIDLMRNVFLSLLHLFLHICCLENK